MPKVDSYEEVNWRFKLKWSKARVKFFSKFSKMKSRFYLLSQRVNFSLYYGFRKKLRIY